MRETLISESLIRAVFALCCVIKQLNGSPTGRFIRPVSLNFSHMYENVRVPTFTFLFISFTLGIGASAHLLFLTHLMCAVASVSLTLECISVEEAIKGQLFFKVK